MAEVASINRKYNELIKNADQCCKSKDYDQAMVLYKNANEIKPELEYPIKQINKLDKIFKLKNEIFERTAKYSYNKAMQLALKTVLNATYGAFANKYFVLSNSRIANAITAMGRDIIRYMVIESENYFYNKWHTDYDIHKLLGLEYIAKGKKDDKYYFLNRNFKSVDRPYQFFNTGEFGDILLSRKIEINRLNKIENVETDDYIILYEYKLFDVKEIIPLDLNPKWKNDPESKVDFYDGNNPITMYCDTDSMYISYKPIMNSLNYKGDELEFILHFDKIVMKPLYSGFLKIYSDRFGVSNKQDFELETISKSILFFEKKNYLKNVVWEDGIFFEPLNYFSPTGIKIIRSETPPFVRGKEQSGGIWDFIKYLFVNPDQLNIKDILKIIKQIRKDFEMEDVDNISSQTSCSNYPDKVINDTTDIEVVLGAHHGVKSAAFYNYLLNRNSEYKTKYDIIRGGKIKYYYCKHPKHNVFGYLRGMHPTEIVEKEGVMFDYDSQFDKTVLSICNSFLKALDLPVINKRLSVLGSIFSFKINQVENDNNIDELGISFNLNDSNEDDYAS